MSLSTHTPHDDKNKEDDPIVASYAVFAKAPLAARRKLLVLQYPNTYSPDPTSLQVPALTEVRGKPKTGIVEVDVPINTSAQYDRAKGIAWGTALKKITAAKEGGSLGLPGGFGVGAPAARAGAGGRRGGAAAGDADEHAGPMSWSEALRQDMVLRTRTLGGRASEETDARYMVAVYQGRNVHLTPVTSLVQVRPHLHHLDAATEQERLARSSASAAGAGTAGGSGKEGGTARAIHMTLKAAMDDDGVAQETMVDRLKAVQTEAWRRMDYVHHESEAAWQTYSESLLQAPPAESAAKVKTEDGDGVKPVVVDDAGLAGAADLAERMSRLEARPGEDDLLRAVSGIKANEQKPGEENATPGRGKANPAVVKTEGKQTDAKPGSARPARATGGATAAARRGGRAGRDKASTSAMDVD